MEEVAGHMYYLRYPLCEPDRVGPDVRAGASSPPSTAPVQQITQHGAGDGPARAQFITVATTRPETMLGDTAIAMNPRDPRAAQFVGKKVKLPIVDREIPIIADDYVVRPPQFGGDENDPK